MKLATLPRYVRHPAFRGADPINDAPAVHAMKRGGMAVVDVHAFLVAAPMYDDAFYPDELDGGQVPGRGDMLVSARFAKGGTSYDLYTKASELARVLGRENVPGEWFGRYGQDALEPRV